MVAARKILWAQKKKGKKKEKKREEKKRPEKKRKEKTAAKGVKFGIQMGRKDMKYTV